MNRCKLEYMYKNMTIEKRKEMIQEIDPKGEYMFNHLICKFLKDPETTNPDILKYIVGWRNPENIENVKQKYIQQYEKINKLCKENKTYPFFKTPNNIKESEETRLDLIKLMPESKLNKFFGVEDFWDYKPPIYNLELEKKN